MNHSLLALLKCIYLFVIILLVLVSWLYVRPLLLLLCHCRGFLDKPTAPFMAKWLSLIPLTALDPSADYCLHTLSRRTKQIGCYCAERGWVRVQFCEFSKRKTRQTGCHCAERGWEREQHCVFKGDPKRKTRQTGCHCAERGWVRLQFCAFSKEKFEKTEKFASNTFRQGIA